MNRSIMLCAAISLAALASAVSAQEIMGDVATKHISEQCGKWIVSFNWSSLEEDSMSTSHGQTDSMGTKVSTDSLTIASPDEPRRVIRIGIMKYFNRDQSLVDPSNLLARANQTLKEAGRCSVGSISWTSIDGRPAAFVTGSGCSGGRTAYAAVYPVDYYFDRSLRAPTSNALGVIFSTYDIESTDRLIRSLHIEPISK